jgi:hypothetical protein
VGLINQAPTEDKPHPYKQIKVGLINQAPTEDESNPHHINQPSGKLIDEFDESSPYRIRIKPSPYKSAPCEINR